MGENEVKSGQGYVPEEKIRSPIEQSACFVKREGAWRMTAFAPAGGRAAVIGEP